MPAGAAGANTSPGSGPPARTEEKTFDKQRKECYDIQALKAASERGEMAEWLKAPVLKTGDVARHRGFESLSLRHFPSLISAQHRLMEKYPRGRRGSPAKGVVSEMAARVQIPASPPKSPGNGRFRGVLLFGKRQINIVPHKATTNSTTNLTTDHPNKKTAPFGAACKGHLGILGRFFVK